MRHTHDSLPPFFVIYSAVFIAGLMAGGELPHVVTSEETIPGHCDENTILKGGDSVNEWRDPGLTG